MKNRKLPVTGIVIVLIIFCSTIFAFYFYVAKTAPMYSGDAYQSSSKPLPEEPSIGTAISTVKSENVTETPITIDSIFAAVNKVRADAGLRPLKFNEQLNTAAKNRWVDMVMRNYFDHFTPDGTPWTKFVRAAGYDYIYSAENLARNFDTTEGLMTAWMASPDHRKNILNPVYSETGIAGDRDLIVQEFGFK